MTEQHPITPPPELIRKLWNKIRNGPNTNDDAAITWSNVITEAAQWGADQELEACIKWASTYDIKGWSCGESLREARRPRLLSLKDQALEILSRDEWSPQDEHVIRRALERLAELENKQQP